MHAPLMIAGTVFNYQSNYYSDLKKVALSLGHAALYLPQYHALTGCDTTAYFYFRGKTQPWERAMKVPGGLNLINQLGIDTNLSNEALADIVEFVRRFVYCGKKGEDLVSTKVRMYEEQASKRSSSLPPDPDSLKYDILRKHHQAYSWVRCLEPVVATLPFNEYGWKKVNGAIVPVWYTCPQFPPGGKKRKKRIEDKEIDVTVDEPPKKRTNDAVDDSYLVDQHIEVEASQQSSDVAYEEVLTKENDNCDETDDYEVDDDDDYWEHFSDFSSSDDSSDDSDWES